MDKTAFPGDDLELVTSLCLVRDLVTIGVLGAKGLATGTWTVGTDFTGSSIVAGSSCAYKNTYTVVGSYIYWSVKSPEKQNTKINITVISQNNYDITIKINSYNTIYTEVI